MQLKPYMHFISVVSYTVETSINIPAIVPGTIAGVVALLVILILCGYL